jgi:hypothetical protein
MPGIPPRLRQIYLLMCSVLHVPIFVLLCFLLWNSSPSGPSLIVALAWFADGALVILPLVWAYHSLYVFPRQFSAVGALTRARIPDGTGSRTVSAWVSVRGWLGWKRYPAKCCINRFGIGFSIPFLGHGFIPVKAIEHVERSSDGSGVVYHASNEVRSPLKFPPGVMGAVDEIVGISECRHPTSVCKQGQRIWRSGESG